MSNRGDKAAQYLGEDCPVCGVTIEPGSLRYEGYVWAHKNPEAPPQAGHHALLDTLETLETDDDEGAFNLRAPGVQKTADRIHELTSERDALIADMYALTNLSEHTTGTRRAMHAHLARIEQTIDELDRITEGMLVVLDLEDTSDDQYTEGGIDSFKITLPWEAPDAEDEDAA